MSRNPSRDPNMSRPARVPGRGKRQKKTANRKRPNPQDLALQLRPEFPGQPAAALHILGTNGVLTTTVTTGVISINLPINASGITSFGIRFLGWNEWRIVKARLFVRMFSSTASGVLAMWSCSAADSSVPTLVDAQQSTALRINFSSVDEDHIFSYTPHDPLEQSWTQMGVNFSSGNFKLYTDAANFGAPIAATAIGSYFVEYTVQLRGLA